MLFDELSLPLEQQYWNEVCTACVSSEVEAVFGVTFRLLLDPPVLFRHE